MCGRYILAQQAKAEKAFGVKRLRWYDMVSYNIAPTREVPVVRFAPAPGEAGGEAEGEREGVMMRWGLIPFFLKGAVPKFATMNARIETMEASPAYRDAWKRSQRCIVPAEGFYEWQMLTGRPKQPWFIGLSNKEVMPFAAIWDRSVRPDGVAVESFAIITMPANEFMARIHNEKQRMPAILRAEDVDVWLRGTPEEAKRVLIQFPAEQLRAHRVSARVNSPKNDDPQLMDEMIETADVQGQLI